MTLIIKTTGLDQYAPGGEAHVKALIIGGPGAGKTRWSSYFPSPIYADCEAGLASVADRKVPYVTVLTSADMLDFLAYLKQECRQPTSQRKHETVVIDTLDAFQRKVKNEWCELNKKETFTGWEAWGYLNAKLQLLMVRLLNLDMNVIVNCHYKDKSTKDDATGKESHELMLQLQGELSDTAFNDFDLVGWMGTYWEASDGERVQKRGLTFKPTPDKPFLKDRLHVTPNWLEVDFAPTDYEGLFSRIQAKITELDATETIGEIPSATPDVAALSNFVVPPGLVGSGPMAPTTAREVPLAQLDRPTLIKRARDCGVTTTVDGSPIKGNTLKAELVAALEAHTRAQPAPNTIPDPAPAAGDPAPPPAATDVQPPAPAAVTAEPVRAKPARKPAAPLKAEAEGLVNTATGEIVEPPPSNRELERALPDAPKRDTALTEVEKAHGEAVKAVADILGGEVISGGEPIEPTPPPAPEPPAPPVSKGVCEDCGLDLENQNPDFVKLGWIKYRKKLCENDYQLRKSSR